MRFIRYSIKNVLILQDPVGAIGLNHNVKFIFFCRVKNGFQQFMPLKNVSENPFSSFIQNIQNIRFFKLENLGKEK